MDPNACYTRWLLATTVRDRRDAARDYSDWADRGGFRATVAYPYGDPGMVFVVDRLTASRVSGYVRRADGTIGMTVTSHRRWAIGGAS